ncbi:MAG: ImmA/IrrE family metallo-endopeptidase [Bacteroidales bacterium]|nr:MAG: ImmA/IrrE family metallo-endopeptidase [Bacteroidales bacterium]
MNVTYININRLNHLLKLYKLSGKELLSILNQGRKKSISENDIFGSHIKISILKKIDELFNKGLSYYIDTKDPKESKEESIFFRKDKFNAELSFGAKQIVTHFEEENIAFSALSKLADFETERKLPFYSINNDPQKVAQEIRKILYPNFHKDRRTFLKSLINKFSEHKILVFEFIETWNKKEKANINGFYLTPSTIVLKRQKSYRREIFTLIHELGHYLLNIEEIDEKIGDDYITYEGLDKIEKWCNDFAYYFLIGDMNSLITSMDRASANNDYHHELVKQISEKTNLSEYALFTRLRIIDKISYNDYQLVKTEFEDKYRENEEKLKKQRELDKLEGKKAKGIAAKPIHSQLYLNTMQSALIEGVIGEYEFCRRLNVKPENIYKYL